jgi:hypothetical protein
MPQSSSGPHSPLSIGAVGSVADAVSGATGADTGVGATSFDGSFEVALEALTVEAGAQTMPAISMPAAAARAPTRRKAK